MCCGRHRGLRVTQQLDEHGGVVTTQRKYQAMHIFHLCFGVSTTAQRDTITSDAYLCPLKGAGGGREARSTMQFQIDIIIEMVGDNGTITWR